MDKQTQQEGQQSKASNVAQQKKEIPRSIQRLPLLVGLILLFVGLKYLFANRTLIFNFLNLDPQSKTLESKIQLFCTVAFPLGLIVALFVQLTMLSRVAYKKNNPIEGNEPEMILLFNRIIDNSVQNSFFFLLNLAYFIFVRSSKYEANYANSVAICAGLNYVFFRIVFCVFYIIGIKINFPTLRGFGLIPSHFTAVMLIFANFGFKPFDIYNIN